MQMLMEVHYQTQFPDLRAPHTGARTDFRSPRDIVLLQAHLLRMGYVVVERDDNRMCPHCTELTLLRTRCHDNHESINLRATNTATAATIPITTINDDDDDGDNNKAPPATTAPKDLAETTRRLHAMGLEPIYNPQTATTMDPWKMQLFQRLDRIRLACGQLCNLNTPAALEEHYMYPMAEGQQLPTIRVPNVNCPAILGQEEIDEGDLSAPGIPPELLSYFTIGNAYAVSNEPRKRHLHGRQCPAECLEGS